MSHPPMDIIHFIVIGMVSIKNNIPFASPSIPRTKDKHRMDLLSAAPIFLASTCPAEANIHWLPKHGWLHIASSWAPQLQLRPQLSGFPHKRLKFQSSLCSNMLDSGLWPVWQTCRQPPHSLFGNFLEILLKASKSLDNCSRCIQWEYLWKDD